MKNFIQPFSKISKSDIALAGGKGASLGEMLGAGFPVPDGFVITAQAFEKFLLDSDLYADIQAQLDRINYQDTNSVDRYSNVIRDMIDKTKFPSKLADLILKHCRELDTKYVAVRSSATAEDSKKASWAGELETYLNTTKKILIENIKKCWSSLFTPRAIFYRHERKLLESKISVAVIVQKMIQSEVAGICFTVHPVTQDKNQMIIEAGYGLGEAVVAGQITPDSYVIDKSKLKGQKSKIQIKSQKVKNEIILDTNISTQERQIVWDSKSRKNKWVLIEKSKQNRQKLSNQLIIKLAKICLKIEQHYKHPQDIEWVFASGKFYITQSRPITTLY